MKSTITLTKSEYRPCYVGNKKALFHMWEDISSIHIAMLKGDVSGQIKRTFGIVEYEDGTIDEVIPSKIRFIEGIFKEYDFAENGCVKEND